METIGETWNQYTVGYYLFAILFLIFDVETVFVFPWATVMREVGMTGFVEILIFFAILGLGLFYGWKKTCIEMGVKSKKEFEANDYPILAEYEGGSIILAKLDDLLNWSRSNSLWPLTFGTRCCAIEFMAVGASRHDMARFGMEVARATPRQADMIIISGTINYKMAPVLKRLYDQIADPKYVIAMGRLCYFRRTILLQFLCSRERRRSCDTC